MFVAMDFMVEVFEGFHYSVDMWLGAIIVSFIWKVLEPLENPGQGDHTVTARKFYPLKEATKSDIIRYLLPGVVAYLQNVGIIPQMMGNYTILAYIAVVVYQLSQFGFQQYTQHTLFCLLYVALGVYL
jgi:hypothetical protein